MKNSLGGIFVGITSITVLVMLVSSFDLFQSKYFPAFILAQKFALPLMISLMGVGYVIFFEPERLHHRGTLISLRTILIVTTLLFGYFFATLNFSLLSGGTIGIYILQLLTLLTVTVFFFLQRKK